MSYGRTIVQKEVAIAAGATGASAVMVAAPTDTSRPQIIVVTAIVLTISVAGTIKLIEDPAGTPADLSGVMTLATGGGLAVAGLERAPVLATRTPNKALGILPVTGNIAGWIRYFLETP